MTASPSRYKYPLSALEALYAHRLEQARLQLAASQQKLDEHQSHIAELRAALDRCHVDWTGAASRQQQFDPARYAAVREALAARQAGLNAAMETGRMLRADVELCREGVAQAHRRTETVKRHKEHAMREFALEAARTDQRQADAAWPVRGERP